MSSGIIVGRLRMVVAIEFHRSALDGNLALVSMRAAWGLASMGMIDSTWICLSIIVSTLCGSFFNVKPLSHKRVWQKMSSPTTPLSPFGLTIEISKQSLEKAVVLFKVEPKMQRQMKSQVRLKPHTLRLDKFMHYP